MKRIYLPLAAALQVLILAPQTVRADENLARLVTFVKQSPCDAKDLAASVLQEVVQDGMVDSLREDLSELHRVAVAIAESSVGELAEHDERKCGEEIRDGVEMVIG